MRYEVQQHAVAVGNKFRVRDDQGNEVFQIASGPFRQAIVLSDACGAVRAVIRPQTRAWRHTLLIEREGTAAAVMTDVGLRRRHFEIGIAGGRHLQAEGSMRKLMYEVGDGERVAARITGGSPAPGSDYTVEITPGEDDILMIAIAAGINRVRDLESNI